MPPDSHVLQGHVDPLSLHALDPDAYPFVLQSMGGGTADERYDVLFAFPEAWLTSRGGHVSGQGFSPMPHEDFWDSLSRWHAETAPHKPPSIPLIGSGWFLYLGYEMAGAAEPSLKLPPSPYDLPDALAVRCGAVLVADRRSDQTWISTCSDNLVQRMQGDIERAKSIRSTSSSAPFPTVTEEPEARFLNGIERIHDYLRAGDSFQINLSRRWQTQQPVDPIQLYRCLRQANPAPFAGLMRWRGISVLSSSPERLLKVKGEVAITRPIAGTHARMDDFEQDARQRDNLISSLKERAEHVMLIDLERNDLGRVCRPGSVTVKDHMVVESYAHVHHIVSEVRGQLKVGLNAVNALKAVFPGGTITGCPKLRSMEIIAELEGEGRGPYTGAIGYLSDSGDLDTNILIRTLVCTPEQVSFRAGAGIVADSNSQAELAETRAKALGLLRAFTP